MNRAVRVLIVDDSSLVRQVLGQGLAQDPGIEVVGSAADPYQARDLIVQLKPDVMTLDVEMPRMDGVTFLRKLLPQYPLPVVMVSSLTERGQQVTLAALEAGAVDFVSKPTSNLAQGLLAMIGDLRLKVKMAAGVDVARRMQGRTPVLRSAPTPAKVPGVTADRLLVIGASTGGTEALKKVIPRLPAEFPPVLVVQHMPPGFTNLYADSLNRLSQLEVKEARDGDAVAGGKVLLAPGGKQMRLQQSGGRLTVNCKTSGKVSGHEPSVDALFQSVAPIAGNKSIGIVLTGMGHDGAEGLLAMRRKGARTLAQDQASSTVFGMPKVAFESGGAEKLVPLEAVSTEIMRLLGGRS